MIDAIENHLQWPSQKTTTETKRIHGFNETVNWNDPFYFYGSDAAALKKNINGAHNTWLSESLKIHEEQVRWAVRHEMARTVEDVLARRTRALLLNAKESIRICSDVAHIMAVELGRNNDWIDEQVNDYTQLAAEYQLA